MSLTDEGTSELADELAKAEPLQLDDGQRDECTASNWRDWTPDPVDAHDGETQHTCVTSVVTLSIVTCRVAVTMSSCRGADIISMLVNIYGSKDMFVKEYQTLLAERILAQFNFDTEREVRYLELLKLRRVATVDYHIMSSARSLIT